MALRVIIGLNGFIKKKKKVISDLDSNYFKLWFEVFMKFLCVCVKENIVLLVELPAFSYISH